MRLIPIAKARGIRRKGFDERLRMDLQRGELCDIHIQDKGRENYPNDLRGTLKITSSKQQKSPEVFVIPSGTVFILRVFC